MSQGTVITQVVITGGSTVVALLANGVAHTKPQKGSYENGIGPYVKVFVGAFGMGLMLTAIAAASPDIASMLGWVIAISALLINGETIARAATNSLK